MTGVGQFSISERAQTTKTTRFFSSPLSEIPSHSNLKLHASTQIEKLHFLLKDLTLDSKNREPDHESETKRSPSSSTDSGRSRKVPSPNMVFHIMM